jgi:hypothetical protein
MRTPNLLAVITALLAAGLVAVGSVSAAATPKRCNPFIYASSVTISGGSCLEATDALRAGRFTGHNNNTFSSSGWLCAQTGTRPRASIRCMKGAATLRFTA